MSEDLIRRSDAIEAYSDIYWIDDRLNLAFREELDKIDEKIRNIPIVEVVDRPQGEWIPCSERLPSEGEYVIVSVLDDHGDTPWKYTAVAWLCNGVWISDNDFLCGTTIAWMPLPKPWKGADDE